MKSYIYYILHSNVIGIWVECPEFVQNVHKLHLK